MQSFWYDLRHAARGLHRNPGFAIVAILTLALGIGANTAIYSVVYGLLVRALPFVNPDQLVIIGETDARIGDISVSYPDFLDWRKRTRSFSGMAAMQNEGFNLAGVDQPVRIQGLIVSPEFLRVLGVRPSRGRDLSGSAAEALVSYSFWQTKMGAAEDAVGRVVTLDGRAFAVVGVLPKSFTVGAPADVIASIGVFERDLTERGSHGDTLVMARMDPGVSRQQAAREMDQIAAQLAAEYPATNLHEGAKVTGLRESIVGDTRMAVLILFGAVSLILLIACANVANLLLVRGAARSREFAVRLALGAGRSRLIRQMLTESLLLAFAGMLPGLAFAWWGARGLVKLVPPGTLPMVEIGIEPAVLLFACLMAVVAAMVCGVVPALRASRGSVDAGLRQGGRAGTGHHPLSGWLAVAETALAVILAIGAGLMVKSMYLLYRVDPGFRPENTVTMELTLPEARYTDAQVQNFWKQAIAPLENIPGVTAAGAGSALPFGGNHSRTDIYIEGQPTPRPGEYAHPDIHAISAGYPKALGLPVIAGRVFEERDTANAPPVVLVNSMLAKRFWGSEANAIGKRLVPGHSPERDRWRTVVGVVSDTRQYGLANPSRLEVYYPYTQMVKRDFNLVVRHRGNAAAVIAAVRAQMLALDRDQPVFGISTMDQLVAASAPIRQMTMVILGLFSSLAIVLSAIGIYGVMAYAAARRTREIGIRMALGAQTSEVMAMMMGSGMKMAAFGAVAGLFAAAGAARLLQGLLYGTASTDPATYVSATALLFAVALIACYVPARRAMRVDPLTALREE
jgi:putative ABC transport system permease protein